MPHTDAFVMPPRDGATVKVRPGRQSLCERAILALRRGGVERIFVSSDCPINAAAIRRLRDRGISLLRRGTGGSTATDGRRLLVVSADVTFEPCAVHALVDRLAAQNAAALAAYEASPGTFAALMPDAAVPVHGAASDRDILDRLDSVRVTSLGGAIAAGETPKDGHGLGGYFHPLQRLSTRLARILTLHPTRS